MDANFEQLVLKTYSAAVGDFTWGELLDETAHFIGAASLALFEESNIDGQYSLDAKVHSTSYFDYGMQDYHERFLETEYRDRNIAKNVLKRNDRIEILSDDTIYENYNEYLERDNVRFMRSLGLRHRAIAFLSKDNLSVAQFTMQFLDGRKGITPQELSRANQILPHLAKSMEMSRIVNSDLELITTFSKTMNGAPAIIVVDDRGFVQHSNDEAHRQAEQIGLFKISSTGKLTFSDRSVSDGFARAIHSISTHGLHEARPRREAISVSPDNALCVEVMPFPESNDFFKTRKRYLFISRDTSLAIKVRDDVIAATFGLTETEIEILNLMISGLENRQIAEQRHRSLQTINNQVKSILRKAGCRNRVELVRVAMLFN